MPKQKKPGRSKVASAPRSPKTFSDVKNTLLRTALTKAGGYPQLAAALGISRQSVHKWDAIPERFAVQVETLYGIPREKIAPALFKGLVRPE